MSNFNNVKALLEIVHFTTMIYLMFYSDMTFDGFLVVSSRIVSYYSLVVRKIFSIETEF